MWIKNIKTGTLQECHNKDVIRICQKEVKNYIVTKDMPVTIEPGAVSNDTAPSGHESLESMTVSELKGMAGEKGLEGYSSLTKAELLELLKEVV